MTKSQETKAKALSAMAAHVLEHGLTSASLRPLAKAANTSDRMLIYHFGSKDVLVGALLKQLAFDMTEKLDDALPATPMQSERALFKEVLALVRSTGFLPYIRIWQEVVASAAMGQQNHIDTGQEIVNGFVHWLECRMPVDVDDPNGAAKAMLTLVEGFHVMDAVAMPAVAESAIDAFYPS
jgi:AcrR family transcriptional regulator